MTVTLDHSGSAVATTGSTLSVAVTTTAANAVVVLAMCLNGYNSTPTLPTISGAGLTWTLISDQTISIAHFTGPCAVWYAIAPTPLTAVSVTATWTAATNAATTMIYASFAGCAITPLDSNASLPAVLVVDTTVFTQAAVDITTTAASTLAVYIGGSFYAQQAAPISPGATVVSANQTNVGAVYLTMQTTAFIAAQTSKLVGATGTNVEFAVIVFALDGTAAAASGQQFMAFGLI